MALRFQLIDATQPFSVVVGSTTVVGTTNYNYSSEFNGKVYSQVGDLYTDLKTMVTPVTEAYTQPTGLGSTFSADWSHTPTALMQSTITNFDTGASPASATLRMQIYNITHNTGKPWDLLVLSIANTTLVAFPIATAIPSGDAGLPATPEIVTSVAGDTTTYNWFTPVAVLYLYDNTTYPDGPLGPTVDTEAADDPTNTNVDPTAEGTAPFPDPSTPEGGILLEGIRASVNPEGLSSLPEFSYLLRGRDVAAVLNGFGYLMEQYLSYYVDNDELSYLQKELDMNNHRIINLADAVSVSDLITKSHVEAIAAL